MAVRRAKGDQADGPSRARESHAACLALYLALPNYLASWRRLGFGDDDFAGGGSDRLVDAMVAWGDDDAIVRRISDHLDAGASQVCVQALHGSDDAAPVGPDWSTLELVAQAFHGTAALVVQRLTEGEGMSTATDQFTGAEIAALRRLLDISAIQEVMLRYCRSADRNDPELMKTIFWDEGTDNHGMYSGSAKGFFERAYTNRDLLSARYHLIGTPTRAVRRGVAGQGRDLLPLRRRVRRRGRRDLRKLWRSLPRRLRTS